VDYSPPEQYKKLEVRNYFKPFAWSLWRGRHRGYVTDEKSKQLPCLFDGVKRLRGNLTMPKAWRRIIRAQTAWLLQRPVSWSRARRKRQPAFDAATILPVMEICAIWSIVPDVADGLKPDELISRLGSFDKDGRQHAHGNFGWRPIAPRITHG
jgi:hypothetical protein